MSNFFASLGLGMRSLQAQRQGVEIAGQNLANVNNPAYSRQRLVIQASAPLPTTIGPQGTGADAVAIEQLRSALVDHQIMREGSVAAYIEAQQNALQYAQSSLGEQIDRSNDSAEGSAAVGGAGAQAGLSASLSDLFNGFQSLSITPDSIIQRQGLLTTAQTMATRFNQTDQRLQNLSVTLNRSISDDVSQANQLLTQIAKLNDHVINSEFDGAKANDLRDLRQARLEDLAKLVNIETAEQPNGSVNVAVSGVSLVSGKQVLDTLEAYDAGAGQSMVRTAGDRTAISLTTGSVQGAIDARDGPVAELLTQVHDLAAKLIASVNAIHRTGYSLSDGTGADLFTGTDASSIAVNAAILADPTQLQASGQPGAPGDNQVALALAQLADTQHADLGNQTFSQKHGQTVSSLGLELASTNNRLSDQEVVQTLLQRQRDSVSGVSLDEELTQLMQFQRAFQASARLVTTIDEMLNDVINLKR